jgi:NADH dehydrogenase
VELAGAIAEIARDTLRSISARSAGGRILLVEGGPRILAAFPPDLAETAERALIRIGVRTRTGPRHGHFHGRRDDRFGRARRNDSRPTVLWAAGVRACPLGAVLPRRRSN